MPPDPTTSDGEALRVVMRRVPSPVTVVTVGGGEPRGVTIGSFTSVSLSPPLVSFNLVETSAVRPLVEKGTRFNVHVLREEQAALGFHFAVPGLTSEQQLAPVEYSLDADGVPLLADVLASLQCRVHTFIEAGDHIVVVADVLASYGPEAGDPALYLDGAFHRIGEALDVSPTQVLSED